MTGVHHSQTFFLLAGSTNLETSVTDNGYHNSSKQFLRLSFCFRLCVHSCEKEHFNRSRDPSFAQNDPCEKCTPIRDIIR